jgi:hypothetical protein
LWEKEKIRRRKDSIRENEKKGKRKR